LHETFFETKVPVVQRLLLIGAGTIARHHAVAALGSSSTAAVDLHVADVDSGALTSFAAQFPQARLHQSADELLALPREPGDVVVVATPPFTHRDLVLAALATDRPVLCEKPLALTVGEAWDMVRAAVAHGQPLAGCDVRFLGLPTTERAKQLLRTGRLGTPYHVTFVNRLRRARSGYDYQAGSSWFRDPDLSGGGVLMDWGPYDVAVINDVLDPERMEVTSAWMASPRTGGVDPAEAARAEQHVGARMRLWLRDGAVVELSYERAACTHGGERSTVEIEGSEGAVEWDWLDWVGENRVRFTRDQDGKPASEVENRPPTGVDFHARPLERLATWLGDPARSNGSEVSEATLFNFRCLRAIHDTAVTGTPQTVERVRL
jgi:predicted dehydrogenase